VGDVYVLRLFVVVPFPPNYFFFNTFAFRASHATLFASNFIMKRSFTAIAFFFFLSLPLLAQSPSQNSSPSAAPAFPQPAHGEKINIPGIPNAGKITDILYRGAQPREVGFSELKLLGITTIVDLRGEDREKIVWERKHAESLGMRFINIPVSGWNPPTDEQVVQFLALFRDNPGQKIFVHCRFGDDRTGVFTAIYRMAMEKWPAEQATKEMYFFGFNAFWHPSMKSFVQNFPARLNSAPALAPLRAPVSQP
jgi:tyrosine-protein phosphatase SIW14